MKVLLAVTTFNHLEYTKKFFETLHQSKTVFDVVVVDDCSWDGTVEYCRQGGYRVVEKTEGKGLTDSWNIAYQIFKQEDYDILFISNNDLLVPRGAIEQLMQVLQKKDCIVCPLTSGDGASGDKKQTIEKLFDLTNKQLRAVKDKTQYDKVQKWVEQRKEEDIESNKFSAFFFGINRSIIRYEFNEDILFDPSNIMVGQEKELLCRVEVPLIVCPRAFIYHYKRISVGHNLNHDTDQPDSRNNLNFYHRRFKK